MEHAQAPGATDGGSDSASHAPTEGAAAVAPPSAAIAAAAGTAAGRSGHAASPVNEPAATVSHAVPLAAASLPQPAVAHQEAAHAHQPQLPLGLPSLHERGPAAPLQPPSLCSADQQQAAGAVVVPTPQQPALAAAPAQLVDASLRQPAAAAPQPAVEPHVSGTQATAAAAAAATAAAVAALPGAAEPAARPAVDPTIAPAPAPAAAAQQQGEEELPLDALRQAFFDLPEDPSTLRSRLAELEALRQAHVFSDGGALWDQLLGRMRRYLRLLSQLAAQQRAAATAAAAEVGEGVKQEAGTGGDPPPSLPPFTPRCDMCGGAAARQSLRRMQAMGGRGHLAVCGACAEQRRGSLIPLTPAWQLDTAECQLIQQALPPALLLQQQARLQQVVPQAALHPPRPPSASPGRQRPPSAQGGGSRPGTAVGHRGKSTFVATSQAWLKFVTKGNMNPSAGLAPRIYLPFGAYWFWVDQLPGAEAVTEDSAPRSMRLVHADSGAAWDVPLLRTDDGMQLQPSALRPLFDALKVEVETYLLIELRHEECSMAGLVAGVRLIPRDEPPPPLPGDRVAAPRHPAVAACLAACKKRKGTHTSSRREAGPASGQAASGGKAASAGQAPWAAAHFIPTVPASVSEAFELNDAWEEAADATVSIPLAADSLQAVDGPSGAKRSKRAGAGGRLASILRQELPEQADDPADHDFSVAAELSEMEEGEALPFAPRQTASVALALELARGLPPDALLYGAHTPTPGTTQKWGVYVKRSGWKQEWFGRLDRARAAVAADLVMTWHGRLTRRASVQNLLAAEQQHGGPTRQYGAPAVHAGGAEAAELAAEVAAMAAMVAAAAASSRAPTPSGERRDEDMQDAGAEGAGEEMYGGRLNLPAAGYQQDAELMEQLRHAESPRQMAMLLEAAVPQDPLPRHLQRHQRPTSAQRHAVLRRVSSLGQMGSPGQRQVMGAAAPPLPPKPHHQRKPVKAAAPAGEPGAPRQQQGVQHAQQELSTAQQQAAGQWRRVGVVWQGEEQGWLAAAVCDIPGGPPTSLRVAGLPTAQLAEVARDLLALWGWQAAQRRQQQAAAAQEPQPRSGSDSGGAPAGAAANNHAADSASAAGGALPPPLLPPLPLPPLNFPLDAYAEQTRLLADLAELPALEVESFVRSAVQQLDSSTLTALEAAAQETGGAAGAAAAPPTPSKPPLDGGEEEAGGGGYEEHREGQASHDSPGGAAGGSGGAMPMPFDLLAALADAADAADTAAAGGDAEPAPQRPVSAGDEHAGSERPAAMDANTVPHAAPVLAPPAAAAPVGQLGQQQRTEQQQQVEQEQQRQHEAAMPPLRQPSVVSESGLHTGHPGSGGAPGSRGSLAAQSALQRALQRAMQAFEAADAGSAEGMLRPLQLLAAARKGGALLRELALSWASRPVDQQQAAFDAALLAVSEGDLDHLEDSLRLALGLP